MKERHQQQQVRQIVVPNNGGGISLRQNPTNSNSRIVYGVKGSRANTNRGPGQHAGNTASGQRSNLRNGGTTSRDDSLQAHKAALPSQKEFSLVSLTGAQKQNNQKRVTITTGDSTQRNNLSNRQELDMSAQRSKGVRGLVKKSQEMSQSSTRMPDPSSRYQTIQSFHAENTLEDQITLQSSQGINKNTAKINQGYLQDEHMLFAQHSQTLNASMPPRHGSKRRSTLTQQINGMNVQETSHLEIQNPAGSKRKNSNQVPKTSSLAHRQKLDSQLKTLGSLDNLNASVGGNTTPQMTRDQQRRKSSSNPKQRLYRSGRIQQHQGHNNLPPSTNQHQYGKLTSNRSNLVDEKQLVHMSARLAMQRNKKMTISNALNYKHGGPSEAYTTHHEMAGGAFHEDEDRTLVNPHPLGRRTSKTVHPSKKHAAKTIQVSRDMNPLNMQHLSSIDRTGSIDSAGYDLMNAMQIPNTMSQNFTTLQRGGVGEETIPVDKLNVSQGGQNSGGGAGFSQMLKLALINKANVYQKAAQQLSRADRNQLNSNSVSLRRGNLQKTEKRGGTKNGIRSTQASHLEPKVTGKLSQAGHKSTGGQRSRLESMIQQMIVRKEISQSPNINQKKSNFAHQGFQNHNQGPQHFLAHQSMKVPILASQTTEIASKRASSQMKKRGEHLKSQHLSGKNSIEDLISRRQRDTTGEGEYRNPDTTISPIRNEDTSILHLEKSATLLNQSNIELFESTFGANLNNLSAKGQTGPLNPVKKLRIQNMPQGSHHNQPNSASLNLIDKIGSQAYHTQNNLALSNNTTLVQINNGPLDSSMIESLGQSLQMKDAQKYQTCNENAAKHKGFDDQTQALSDPSSSFFFKNAVSGELKKKMSLDQPNLSQPGNSILNSNSSAGRQLMRRFESMEQPITDNRTPDGDNIFEKRRAASDRSVESKKDIYKKTLDAYQADLQKLHMVNQTQQELSSRIQEHQSILNNLQESAPLGANKSDRNGTLQSEFKKPVSNQNTSSLNDFNNQQFVHNMRLSLAHLSSQEQSNLQNQHAFNQQNSTQAQQESFIQSNMTVYSGQQINDFQHPGIAVSAEGSHIATSPIVGRYRLKKIQEESQNKTIQLGHQNVYMASSNVVSSRLEHHPKQLDQGKRTKSVRHRKQIPSHVLGSTNASSNNLNNRNRRSKNADQFESHARQASFKNQNNPNRSSASNVYTSSQPTGRDDFQTTLLPVQVSQQMSVPRGNAHNFGNQTQVTAGTLKGRKMAGQSVPKQRGLNSNLRGAQRLNERSLSTQRNKVSLSGMRSGKGTIVARNAYKSIGSGSITLNAKLEGERGGGKPAHKNQQYLSQLQNTQQSQTYQQHQQSFEVMPQNALNTTMNNSISPINRNQTHSSQLARNNPVRQVKERATRKQQQQPSSGRGRQIPAHTNSSTIGISKKNSKVIKASVQTIQGSKSNQIMQLSQQQVNKIRRSMYPADSVNNLEQSDQTPQQKNSPQNLSLSKNINRFEETPQNQAKNNQNQRLYMNPTLATQENSQPLVNRNHNLRYSQANYDMVNSNEEEIQDDILVDKDENNIPQTDQIAENQQNAIKNEARKLLNEDNPFEVRNEPENQQKKFNNFDPFSGQNVQSQAISFGGTTITDKTTNRASKNTAAGQSATLSGGTSNLFSLQSRRMILAQNNNQPSNVNQEPKKQSQPFQPATVGRKSLLGMAQMRRSEVTEDSQQCMYNDSAMIMSSLPMPMHSIKQVIAEEEAAAEQDEKTTNKESSRYNKGRQTGGEALLTDRSKRSSKMMVEERSQFSLCQSNSRTQVENLQSKQDSKKEEQSQMSTKKQVYNKENLSDSIKIESESVQQDQKSMGSKGKHLLQEHSLKGNSKMELSVRHSESGVLCCDTPYENPTSPNQTKKVIKSSKNSETRSKAGNALLSDSEDGNLICQSVTSVQNFKMKDKIGELGGVTTPDIQHGKNLNFLTVAENGVLRKSQNFRKNNYNNNAVLESDFPPQLSESSIRPDQRGSDHHSDDDIEIRRGLESEKGRSDMGSKPELLRQSTHSLLNKQDLTNKVDLSKDMPADMLYRAQQSVKKSSQIRAKNIPVKAKQVQKQKDLIDSDGDEPNLLEDSITVSLNENKVQRPTQLAARNNNYFDSEQENKNTHGGNSRSSKERLTKDQKLRLSLKDNSINFCEDGEEMVEEIELIEGVTDADAFTLNKIN